MNFINKKMFWNELKKKFPLYDHYFWFSYALYNMKEYRIIDIKGKISLKRLIDWTNDILIIIGADYPLIVFPDRMSGWKNSPRNRLNSPVRVENKKELEEIIRNHMQFKREGGLENYHITTRELNNFIIFDHEGWWSLYAINDAVDKVKKKWKLTNKKKKFGMLHEQEILGLSRSKS